MLKKMELHYSDVSDEFSCPFCAGADTEGGDWGHRPLKTGESNLIHHDFVQFGKQHSRYKAIVSSIVWS